ncbi:MAG: zinc ribbon domain-containing protein, partial [Clostridia bacterium]
DETVEKARCAADVTAKKAGEILDIAKVNIKISDYKNNLEKLYNKIGKLVYDATKNDSDNSTEINDLILIVNESIEKIEDLQEQLSTLRGLKKCPNCFKNNPKDSVFCSSCGSEL